MLGDSGFLHNPPAVWAGVMNLCTVTSIFLCVDSQMLSKNRPVSYPWYRTGTNLATEVNVHCRESFQMIRGLLEPAHSL